MVFLLTLYLQKVLGYSPLAAGLSFAVLGAGTVLGGCAGPKLIGPIGTKNALVAGFLLQAAGTLPSSFSASGSGWIVVAAGRDVHRRRSPTSSRSSASWSTATSGLPDGEQGLATGLTTMSQQVGITMGIPIMSAIATAPDSLPGRPQPAHGPRWSQPRPDRQRGGMRRRRRADRGIPADATAIAQPG